MRRVPGRAQARENQFLKSSAHFDEDQQRRQLREGFDKLKGCNVEVHMHEPMSVQGDVARIARWAEIAKEEAGR